MSVISFLAFLDDVSLLELDLSFSSFPASFQSQPSTFFAFTLLEFVWTVSIVVDTVQVVQKWTFRKIRFYRRKMWLFNAIFSYFKCKIMIKITKNILVYRLFLS